MSRYIPFINDLKTDVNIYSGNLIGKAHYLTRRVTMTDSFGASINTKTYLQMMSTGIFHC